MDCEALRIPILPGDAPRLATPAGFLLPLLPHQERSLARMVQVETDGTLLGADFGTFLDYKSKGGCLADKIGMGKTAMVLGLIMHELASDFHGPTLVVAPGHLLQQWADEAAKFVAAADLRVYNGVSAFDAARRAGARLNNRALVLVNLSDVLGASYVLYTFRKVYEARSGAELRWSAEDLAAATKIATSISGGYSGPLYTSSLHAMRAVRAPDDFAWRRVVFEETQDLVADGRGTQDNFMQIAQAARNVWLVTATPFPRGDDSIYANNQLLGFKRLRLSVAGMQGALPSGHPLELIKRRLYVRNSEAEVKAALASISGRVVEEWRQVPPLPIETLLVDAATREADAKSTGGANEPWASTYVPVRAACSSPAACVDFQKSLGTGEVPASAYDLSSGNLHWLAGRLSKFVKEQVNYLQKSLADSKVEQLAALCGVAIVKKHQANLAKGLAIKIGLPDSTMQNICSQFASASPEAAESIMLAEDGILFRGIVNQIAQAQRVRPEDVNPMLRGPEAVRRYLSRHVPDDRSADHYITITTTFLDDRVAALERKEARLERAKLSASQFSRALQDGGSTEGSMVAKRWGSKLSALLDILKAASLERQKVIVFSMFEDVLDTVSHMLRANSVPCAMFHGNSAAMKAEALRRFVGPANGTNSSSSSCASSSRSSGRPTRANDEVDVLLLSTSQSASGANLQVASMVVFLDPPGTGGPADGAALDKQAVGRAVRMGQSKAVRVVRMAQQGSVEEAMWAQIRNAQVQEGVREAARGDSYVCERTDASFAIEAAAKAAANLAQEKEAKIETDILGVVDVSTSDRVANMFEEAKRAGRIIEIVDDEDDANGFAELAAPASDPKESKAPNNVEWKVTLEKPLGLNFYVLGKQTECLIESLVDGGNAAANGTMVTGDKIVAVDGVSTFGMAFPEFATQVKASKSSIVTLMVRRSLVKEETNASKRGANSEGSNENKRTKVNGIRTEIAQGQQAVDAAAEGAGGVAGGADELIALRTLLGAKRMRAAALEARCAAAETAAAATAAAASQATQLLPPNSMDFMCIMESE